MIMQIYTVYDNKTEVFMRPWYALTDGEAMRIFTDAVADPQSPYSKHPLDFTLYHIGSFNDHGATFEGRDPIHQLGTAVDFTNPTEDPNG